MMGLNLIKRIYASKSEDEMLAKLKDYTYSCSYLKHEDTKLRVQVYIDNYCDMRLSALELDIPMGALKTSISYVNEQLKYKVGDDIVDRIEAGDKMAEVIIESAVGSCRPVLAEGWAKIPHCKATSVYDLENCRRELAFMALYSKSLMEKRFEACDSQKLAYIKRLICEPQQGERLASLVLNSWLKHIERGNIAETDELMRKLKARDGLE